MPEEDRINQAPDIDALALSPEDDVNRIEILSRREFIEHLRARPYNDFTASITAILNMNPAALKEVTLQSTRQLRTKRHQSAARNNGRTTGHIPALVGETTRSSR